MIIFRGCHFGLKHFPPQTPLTMEDLAERRKALVQTLRRVARSTSLPLVRDDVGFEKVAAFAQALEDSDASEVVKQQAREAFAAYEATWTAESEGVSKTKRRLKAKTTLPTKTASDKQATGSEANNNGGAFRLRGTSFLFTYNWDFFGKTLPDGTGSPQDTEQLWALWQDWAAAKGEERSVLLSTSTLERSLHSALANRVHLHWKVVLELKQDPTDSTAWAVGASSQPFRPSCCSFRASWKVNVKVALNCSSDPFCFHGVRPDARPTVVAAAVPGQTRKARGANFLEASNRVHFYTWVPKPGSLFVSTNYKPFEQYRVLGKWLDDLWSDGKLGHESYKDLASRVRCGYAARKRDLEQVLAEERESRVNDRLTEVAQQLELLKAPPRFFQAVRDWEDSFLLLNFRWKLLLLWAGSASGKSTFAEGLFENVLTDC